MSSRGACVNPAFDSPEHSRGRCRECQAERMRRQRDRERAARGLPPVDRRALKIRALRCPICDWLRTQNGECTAADGNPSCARRRVERAA